MCVSHSLSTCDEWTREYCAGRHAHHADAGGLRRRRVFFFGGAGADAMVLEPDDPNRRALHDVDVAVSIKVDGVHRRRALAINSGGQQRRRERHDAAASHSRAFCDAWPWRVVCGGARVAWPPGSNRFHQYCELRGDGSRTFSDRGARAIDAPPRARACQPSVGPWDDARLL